MGLRAQVLIIVNGIVSSGTNDCNWVVSSSTNDCKWVVSSSTNDCEWGGEFKH